VLARSAGAPLARPQSSELCVGVETITGWARVPAGHPGPTEWVIACRTSGSQSAQVGLVAVFAPLTANVADAQTSLAAAAAARVHHWLYL